MAVVRCVGVTRSVAGVRTRAISRPGRPDPIESAMSAPVTARAIPMSERSVPGVVGMFFVLPLLVGGALLAGAIVLALKRDGEPGAPEGYGGVAWMGLLALGLITALPAAGWQELRKRRALKVKAPPPVRPSR